MPIDHADEPDPDATTGILPKHARAAERTGIAGGTEAPGPSRRRVRAQRGKPAATACAATRYQTTGLLGRGGWGIVESAIDGQLQRSVAIKRIACSSTISPAVRDRFLHEARITSQLQHPGIVPVHELATGDGQDDAGEAYYVMKLLSGRPLRQLIREAHAGLPSTPRVGATAAFRAAMLPLLERFILVCEAVAYAHQRGVLHRDLKPANVMIGEFGETIVVDWGLAKQFSQDSPPVRDREAPRGDLETTGAERPVRSHDPSSHDPSSHDPSSHDPSSHDPARTRDGSVIGTPAYMPPEQAKGDLAALSPAADVFALGGILYEILAGRHPHAGYDAETALQRVRGGRWDFLAHACPGVPRPLTAIVGCAMAVDPAARYASAVEMAEEVRRYIAGDAVRVDRETWIDLASRWCRRHRTLTISVGGATLTLMLASLIFGHQIRQAHQAERLAHQETQAAYQETLEQLEQSRRFVDGWLIDSSGSLEFQPAWQPTRPDLIEQAIERYQDLLADDRHLATENHAFEPAVKARLDLERAKLHLRLADLQRIKQVPAEAHRQYQAAAEVLRADRDSRGLDPALRNAIRLQAIQAAIGELLLGNVEPDSLERDRRWLRARLREAGVASDRQPAAAKPPAVYDLVACLARLHWASGQAAAESPAARESPLHKQRRAHAKAAVDWSAWLVRSRGTPADHRLWQTALTQWTRGQE